jgi:hypothetical protein
MAVQSTYALYIQRFAGIVSERTQCGETACDDAGLRINQRSVEVQQYGAGWGHARNMVAGGSLVDVCSS